jgi:uncharacterized protein
VTTFFFDSSALTKRYVTETGTEWVRKIASDSEAHLIVIASITLIEVMSAVTRKEREGVVRARTRQAIQLTFMRHVTRTYEVIDLSRPIITRAQQLTVRHPLRAYDSTQLATALEVNSRLVADGAPAITFVCADTRLLAIAAAS